MEASAAPALDRSRRVYVWWGVGFAFLVLLGAFCWLVLRPLLEVRRALAVGTLTDGGGGDPTKGLASLGGPERAGGKLWLYLRLPAKVAPYKDDALDLLCRCGRPALPFLLHALRDQPDGHGKTEIIMALRDIGPAAYRAVPDLAAALESSDVHIRGRAAEALGEIGPRALGALPALIRLIDRGAGGGQEAIQAVALFGPDAREAIPALVKALGYSDRSRCPGEAADALAAMGPEAGAAVPLLAKMLDDADFSRPRSSADSERIGHAAWALARVGAPAKAALPSLIRTFESGGQEVRTSCCWAFEALGPEASPALPALLRALKAGEIGPFGEVATALEAIGPAAKPALPDLHRLLEVYETSIGTRSGADVSLNARSIAIARALCRLGPVPKVAVDVLICESAPGRAFAEETAAVAALGAIGPVDSRVIPALIAAIADEKSAGDHAAMKALGRIGPAAAPAVPVLQGRLRRQTENYPIHAVQALGAIGPGAADAVPEIRERLNGGSAGGTCPADLIRVAAALALWRIAGDREQLANLTAFCSHARREVRQAAARALGNVGPPAAGSADVLTRLAGDRYEFAAVRAAAAESLKEIQGEGAGNAGE